MAAGLFSLLVVPSPDGFPKHGLRLVANLTPDENTGIGSWSEDTFVRALRTGRHMGVSRPILPPMPWGAFRNLTDEDLRSIYAYLKAVPPVKNRGP